MNPHTQLVLTAAGLVAITLILAVGLGPAVVLIVVAFVAWIIRRDEND